MSEIETKTIEQIRKGGIDKVMMERIISDRAEMERPKEEAKARLPGQFISLKSDRESKTLLFSGSYQKLQVPAKDFITKQIIPGKTVTKFRFQVYDVTNPDMPSEAAIFERGYREAEQILWYLSQGKQELVIMRNGSPGSQNTFYNIYPAK